jgi:hypothetical protein
VLSVLGASCFVLEKLFWMRGLAGETFAGNYGRLVAPETVGFGGVFQTLISNPLYVLGAVLSTEKLVLALQLFVPLAFLPVRRAKTLFLLIPGAVIIGLATDSPAVAQIHFQYVCHFVPYLFIAAVVVLASMGRRQRIAALAAVALGTAIATQHFGALLHEDFKVSFQEVSFSWSAEDDRHLADLRAIIGAIPPDRSLAVGDYEGAHTARRRHLLDIKSGIHGSDYVLYGVRSFRWGGLDEVRAALASGVYGVVARRGEFAVLARGADPGGNVAELERLSH